MEHQQPEIVIDFHRRRLQFKNPLQVWHTADVQEIESIFEQVQQAIDNGLYVVGYVSYESAAAFDKHYCVCLAADGDELPLIWFAAYTKPETEPQPQQQTVATAEAGSGRYELSEWKMDTSSDRYTDDIARIHGAIARGETYQVNYTTRLRADFAGDDFAYYERLREGQQADFAAYLNIGRYRIASVSPELFFEWKGRTIRTKPMKGTMPRSANKQALYQSEKNRAENVMIVDLLRNDIGRIAETGSVHVPKLFEIEEYPTLYQMTSTVEATVQPERTLFELFQALFPCGSITGAPKISTMQIIAELEQQPRHIYCGAIGLAVPGEGITFNVAIRTVLIDSEKKQAVYGVGGGVIWDSTAADEYAELHTKAKILTYQHQAAVQQL
ncbi:aminodeoxychorismate synthase component I [Paenibacillus sp. GCM10027626]|uniref:aminodeoxychorismate synthase component I n=1 Tax=Paenibacillus sp. GCM10027626 TaxID=3273411 RepID=UPI003640055A